MDFTTKFRGATFEIQTRKMLRDGAVEARARAPGTVTALDEQLATLAAQRPMRARAIVDVADGAVRGVRLLDAQG